MAIMLRDMASIKVGQLAEWEAAVETISKKQ